MGFSISRFISGAGEGLAQTGKSMGDAARTRENAEALENLRSENDMKRQEMIEASKGAHEQARLTSEETRASNKIASEEKMKRDEIAEKYSPENRDRLKAAAEESRAKARYYDAGGKPTAATEKANLPELFIDKDTGIVVDKKTGATGRKERGSSGSPGEKNWLFPDTPATPAKPSRILMTDPETGEEMPLVDFNKKYYPKVNVRLSGGKRGVDSELPAEPQTTAPESPVEFSLNGPATGPTMQGGVPTEKDLRWLKTHPDLKDKFLMKFGALPEGLDLPE